jgi:hypothetical protein
MIQKIILVGILSAILIYGRDSISSYCSNTWLDEIIIIILLLMSVTTTGHKIMSFLEDLTLRIKTWETDDSLFPDNEATKKRSSKGRYSAIK